jgi:PAS domain S-box-containing protein
LSIKALSETFEVFLRQAARQSAKSMVADSKPIILVVDDNVTNLNLFFDFLQVAGYQVLIAEDGKSALERLKHVKPDLILLDVMMPELDGFEVCDRLQKDKNTKNIPVIFMTALSSTNDIIKGFEMGAVDYLIKPVRYKEALARINNQLQICQLQKDLQAQNKQLREENTRRMRVQDALRESRERYRLLAENSTDLITRQSAEGIYLYVSPACRTLLGFEVEDMVGKPFLEFFHPEAVETEPLFAQPMAAWPAVSTITCRARRKDGSYIWLETTAKIVRDDKTGLIVEVTAVSRNVTERKEAEDALQEAHHQLEIRVQERTAELAKTNVAFGRFVPHEFLRYLGKDSILDVSLGDQVQGQITILCSDIRAFTTLSETMSPQESFSFLNDYLGHVSPIIRHYHGFIDKYMGDAVMALFPEKPEHGLQAAIAMRQEMTRFNQQLQERGRQPVITGTSVHTGSCMLGIIGEAERMESTVIADAVNLAFRLEGLTKMYGASIVMSQDTLFNLNSPTQYQFRFLDRVRVRGKREAVSVFEVFDGDPLEVVSLKVQTQTDFEKGLLHYHSREFTQAQTFFETVLSQNPTDRAAQLYLKRATHFVEYGVPPDWEGVEALTEK